MSIADAQIIIFVSIATERSVSDGYKAEVLFVPPTKNTTYSLLHSTNMHILNSINIYNLILVSVEFPSLHIDLKMLILDITVVD